MLLVAVGLLVVVDLTIIITYMVVVGTMDGLGARETSFAENPQDTQGVSYIHIEVSLELQYYVAKRLTIMTHPHIFSTLTLKKFNDKILCMYVYNSRTSF